MAQLCSAKADGEGEHDCKQLGEANPRTEEEKEEEEEEDQVGKGQRQCLAHSSLPPLFLNRWAICKAAETGAGVAWRAKLRHEETLL